MSENKRKVVCISYETGKTVRKSGATYPETKLLTVGSAFVDSTSGRISGQFLAVPPQWNGRFVILDPLPKRTGEEAHDDLPQEEYQQA